MREIKKRSKNMKKIITILLVAAMVFVLAACGTAKVVLEDKTHELWVAHGQYLLADGTQNGWNGKDNSLYEKSALKAIALEDVKEISQDLYTTLSKKDVKYLYTIDIIVGTNDAGWSCKFVKDGKLYNANGSYAVKVAQCTSDVDGDTKVYAEEQWISDPHTAHVESLTPATMFYPTWTEEKDENGFSWADNPVVTGGAGLYTLVIAQYSNASSASQPGFGVGLVLKEAKEGIAYEEIKTWIPADHTYGVIGNFAGSDWGTDVDMTAAGDNTWQAEVTLAAGNELKVRADHDWTNSWGNGGDNFKVEEAGTYVVTITFSNGQGTVTVTKK